ncbi:PadR family transcriptional regulator, partial [Salmonella enterica subsp. enterica serovar Give]|nr:PadR family transcriptional regulator [Salmonella enterica subsp. enterica serovar Give]
MCVRCSRFSSSHSAHQHENASCGGEHRHGHGCGRHGQGGGRRQRFFGHGELRL